jgi:hypothetical protein
LGLVVATRVADCNICVPTLVRDTQVEFQS